MNRNHLNNDLYRAVVLTILAGLATVTVAMANRNVYSKTETDSKLETLHTRIDYIQNDLEWLVRHAGGTPSAPQAEQDNHTP